MHGLTAKKISRNQGVCRADAWKGNAVRPPDGGMKHFLHIDDFSTEEIRHMLRNAARAKTAFYNRDQLFKPFDKWTMAMIFTKPSARTRVSFETVCLALQRTARPLALCTRPYTTSAR